MSVIEKRHGVWLKNRRVGVINQRGDYTWFQLLDDYVEDPQREILGLVFEDNLKAVHARAMMLPPWFSNLLPEGRLREAIAKQRGVSASREMELLAQVGHDLPGAVRVLDENGMPEGPTPQANFGEAQDEANNVWRFSLAGVAIKFSMIRRGQRLTLPAHGEGGDWIVKMPDPNYTAVPANEDSMMTLAKLCGIDIPEHKLIARDELDGLPESAWHSSEEMAYAVRRFDRSGPGRDLVHMEDFAQVRNIDGIEGRKYTGSFDTIAALIYRQRHLDDLKEFARRLAFNYLISNGDAHLKNWSLLYADPRSPRLSPAYDLVSTAIYSDPPGQEDMGLKFGKSKRFEDFRLSKFERLQIRLGATHADLSAEAEGVARKVRSSWPTVAEQLDEFPSLRDRIGTQIEIRVNRLLGD